MKDNIELPMQVVLNTPVRPRDFENSLGREPLGEGNIAHGGTRLALGIAPLGPDARDGDKAGKARRVGRLGQHSNAPALPAVVATVVALVNSELAGGLGPSKGSARGRVERPVVGLQAEGIMRAAGAHRLGHARMTMQGIAGNDTALQYQAFQGRQGSFDLVPTFGPTGRNRQPGFGIPYTDHQRRHVGAPALVAAPKALAID